MVLCLVSQTESAPVSRVLITKKIQVRDTRYLLQAQTHIKPSCSSTTTITT